MEQWDRTKRATIWHWLVEWRVVSYKCIRNKNPFVCSLSYISHVPFSSMQNKRVKIIHEKINESRWIEIQKVEFNKSVATNVNKWRIERRIGGSKARFSSRKYTESIILGCIYTIDFQQKSVISGAKRRRWGYSTFAFRTDCWNFHTLPHSMCYGICYDCTQGRALRSREFAVAAAVLLDQPSFYRRLSEAKWKVPRFREGNSSQLSRLKKEENRETKSAICGSFDLWGIPYLIPLTSWRW